MTDSDMATQAGEEHVSRAHVPIPRGGDPAFPNLGIHGIHTIHGRYLCQNGLTYHDQNWCGNMWGQHVSRRSVMPHPKGGGQRPKKFQYLLDVCTQYEEQQPNFARWSNKM